MKLGLKKNQDKIMKKIVVSIVLIFFYSCLHKNKQNSFIDSPSKKYYIASKVNNAEVIIHLYDFKKNKIDFIKTGVGDFNKWELRWTLTGDTIKLFNSDIGNKFYIVENDKIVIINN